MGINKVVYGDQTLVDLTEDTVTPETLLLGETAHDASGELIVGTATGGSGGNKIIKNQTLTFTNLVATVSDSDISADSDFAVYYYNEAAAQAAGITAVSSNGVITFTAQTEPQSTIVVDIVLFEVGGGGGGTTVVANPAGEATADLEKIKINNVIYAVHGGNNDDIPSYYNTEFATTKASVESHSTATSSNVIFMTDLHFSSKDSDYYPAQLRTPLFNTIKAAKKFAAQVPIDQIVIGGDYMQFPTEDMTKQMGIDNIAELNEMLYDVKTPVFALAGNHEGHYNGGTGIGLSDGEIGKLLSRKYVNNTTIPVASNVFVRMDDFCGICHVYISTDQAAKTKTAVNANWASVNEVNINNYPYVIYNHFGSTDAVTDDVDSDIKDAIDTILGTGSTIIAWISGHKHFDWVHVYNNVLVVSILNSGFWTNERGQDGEIYTKTVGTASESAFSVLTIVQETGKLFVTRFGAGVDFECNYNTISGAVGRVGYIPTDTYSVSRTMNGGTISNNNATTVVSGASYTNTITVPDSHFTIGTVSVTMGGTDVTSSVYNSSTHTIAIPSVNGDIVITADASNNYFAAMCETKVVEQYDLSAPATIIPLEGNSFTLVPSGNNSGIKFYIPLKESVTQGFTLKCQCDNIECTNESSWGVRAYMIDSEGNTMGSNIDYIITSKNLTELIDGVSGWVSSACVGAVKMRVQIRCASSGYVEGMTATFTNMRFEQ